MPSSHLVTNRNLSLLGNVNADRLIYSRRKFISVISRKYLCINNNSIFTMRHLKRSVPYLPGFLTKNCTKQPLLCSKLCLTLWSYLAYKDVPCTHLGTNTNNSSLIKIFKRIVTDTWNVTGNLLRPKLRVTSLSLIFLNVYRCVYIILYQTFT